jgi:TonB family protein
MMRITLLALAVLAAAQQERLTVPMSENFAAAKGLYASGAYEEALSRLSNAPAEASAEADQYRALCLLALGRTSEAERSLETLISRAPFFKMSEAEVSPRLVTMFHAVRKRSLPAATKALYTTAKTSFERKDYKTASSQLQDLLSLIADEDLASEATTFADIKLLAEGFLKLAEMEMAVAAKAEAAPPAAALPTLPPLPAGPAIYSESDKDVKPPVELSQQLPPWNPPSVPAQLRESRGVLRIIIDELGQVESAYIVQSVSASYDSSLLAATKSWKYRPATRNGEPVKFQKIIGVVLRGR